MVQLSKQLEGSESHSPDDHDIDGQDRLDGKGEGEGIELTMGEPNSFEPEEDPEAASRDAEVD